MRIGIGGPRLQPLDELILVFRGAVDLSFLGPALQPGVDLRGRDAAFLRDAHDVLVVRDTIRSREFVDDVPDRDDLFALGLADAGLDDVDVEATFLARDLAHPVLDDAHRALRVVRGHGLAEPHPSSRLRETDNRFELTWGDRDARTRRFPGPPDVEVFFLDDRHDLDRHDRVDALRVGHILAQEVRIQVRRVRFFEGLRFFGDEARLATPPDLADAMALQDVLREFPIAVCLRPIVHGEDDVETVEESRWRVNLFRDVLVLVEPAELRIRCGEDGTPRLEDGRDARLRHADPLLFHRLMDRGSILRVHLLDLVDAVVNHDPVANEIAQSGYSEVVDIPVVFFDSDFNHSVEGVVASSECRKTIVGFVGEPRLHVICELCQRGFERPSACMGQIVQLAPVSLVQEPPRARPDLLEDRGHDLRWRLFMVCSLQGTRGGHGFRLDGERSQFQQQSLYGGPRSHLDEEDILPCADSSIYVKTAG